jgi:phage-related minor tail protein
MFFMSDTAPVSDDLDRIEASLDSIHAAAERASGSIASAFSRGIAQGKDFEVILRGVGQRLIDIGLQAAFKPLETGISGFLSSLTSGLTGGLLGGGGAGNPISITPFAEGGVVSAPHYFPMGGGLGLAGERGSEAILPLARGPDGRLGVAASGAGRAMPSVNVTVMAQDVDSFRRSETQIAAAMTRALARGQRGL